MGERGQEEERRVLEQRVETMAERTEEMSVRDAAHDISADSQ